MQWAMDGWLQGCEVSEEDELLSEDEELLGDREV